MSRANWLIVRSKRIRGASPKAVANRSTVGWKSTLPLRPNSSLSIATLALNLFVNTLRFLPICMRPFLPFSGRSFHLSLCPKIGGSAPTKSVSEVLTKDSADFLLHDAAFEGNIKLVKKYLGEGINLDAKNEVGNTALHYAAFKHKWKIVDLLVANGAKLNPRGNDGNAPTPIFRPRIGFFKVEPAMSQFRVMTALRPSVPDAVTECSPSPKGRPVGPRAQRSNGISSLAFISCLLHIQIPLRVSRCPALQEGDRMAGSFPRLAALRNRSIFRCSSRRPR